MGILKAVLVFLRAMLILKIHLAVENLALRQQLAVCKQSIKRPKLRPRDRVFWVWLSRLWPNWSSALAIVQPESVIRWHRLGFKLYWRWKSRARQPGRPPIEREIRDLIRRMSLENPTWGAPRILSELLLLGYDVAEGTVAKYMALRRKPSSQTWRTFLDNHVPDIAACDFFTVPTVTFRVLRECLDHVIVLGEVHLKRILTDCFEYYHGSRPHLSLDRYSPTPRDVEPPSMGPVIAIAQVGGLHHRYARAA